MQNKDWEPVSLRDLIDIKHGFAFKGEFFRDEPSDNVLLTPGNFAIGGGFKGDKFKFYVGPIPDEFVLETGDLVVTMTDLSKGADTLGYPAVVPAIKGLRFLHNQRLGKVIIRANSKIRKDFLYYLLRTQEYRLEIIASATGTTVKHTAPERIKAFKFELPPIPEQRGITQILSMFDDKIALNYKVNKTLEEIVHTIFKSWFVDFDPVRARAEGHVAESIDETTAALFPDSFEDSELGEIPRGWQVETLSNAVTFSRNGLNPSDYPDEIFNHYSIPAFDEGQWPKMEPGSQIKSNKFIVAPESVLLSKLNPQFPRVWLPFPGSTLRSICSTEFLVSIPKLGATREFLYSLFKSDQFATKLVALVTGTSNSHQRAKAEHILNLKIVLPSDQCIKKYTEITQPIFSAIFKNLEQSRTLAAIRDALLPKLIAGDIRVRL